jgi:hypothetical protein
MRRQRALSGAIAKYSPVIKYGNIDVDHDVKVAQNFGRKHDLNAFVGKVRTGGDWDFKDSQTFAHFGNRPLLQEFGNFFFGIVAHAYGFTAGESIAGAGIYQTFRQGHNPGYRLSGDTNFAVSALMMASPIPINAILFDRSDTVAEFEANLGLRFGDNPDDTPVIIAGYNYYGAQYGH